MHNVDLNTGSCNPLVISYLSLCYMRNVNLTISTGANEPFATVVILYTAMIEALYRCKCLRFKLKKISHPIWI